MLNNMFFILDGLNCSGEDLATIMGIVNNIITLIQIAIPIMLVIWGSLDLGKAVVASKDDEIKKAQQTLIKRAISAALVFLLGILVNFIVGLVKDNAQDGYDECRGQLGIGLETSCNLNERA